MANGGRSDRTVDPAEFLHRTPLGEVGDHRPHLLWVHLDFEGELL
jgi:hypothetical protein